MSDIIIELGSDRWTKTEVGWYLERIKGSGEIAYEGIPDGTERKLLEEIARLQAESDANRREAESNGRFELRFVEELDAIKAAVKFEETADSDGPVTLVQWCERMATENKQLQADNELLNEEAETLVGSEAMALSRVLYSAGKRRIAAGIATAWWKQRDAVRAELQRLTECDLESIDWDERTITLRYPDGIDGLEVRAGLKIKADLTPMQPTADTEPPASDQTYIL